MKATRTVKGQAFIPIIIIGVFVILVIGVFAFEVGRAAIIRDQLRTACESTALAGTAALAGSPELDPATSQTKALAAAKTVFVKNEIFGHPLNAPESDFDNKPADGHVKLRMQYLDPKDGNKPVSIGDPKGKVLEVAAKFGLKPAFADFIGLSTTVIPLTATAQGGVGDLDIVLCFDVSGSMDDETKITRVRRKWDPATAKVVHEVIGQGKLATSHAAHLPQELQFGPSFNPSLRGATMTSAPGNFPPGAAAVSGFTDVVVNVDEKDVYAGLTVDGFDFPNVGVLVEAARGNLENAAVFDSSEADTVLGGIITPKPGYQAKYLEIARKHIHPLNDAVEASKDFFTLMNKNSNAHLGIVSFHGDIGQLPETTFNKTKIASSYAAGGTGEFGLPAIALKKPEPDTNFPEVMASVDKLVAFGATNIGGATSKAIDMFDTGSRPMAKKAVIVFTDGSPTVGGPLSGDPEMNCRLAAQKAKTKGIALYTVGLALNPALLPAQAAVLGDNTPNGMAKIAGNGSKFFPVTDSSKLRAAFANIARHLSSLVQ